MFIDSENWASLGGADTAREIFHQPEVWIENIDVMEKTRPFTEIFNARVNDKKGLLILTGAGTSSYVGDVVADYLNSKLKCAVRSIPSTDIVSNPEAYLCKEKPVTIVSLARSGSSPESNAVVDRGRNICRDVYFLNITCNKNGDLRKKNEHYSDTLNVVLPARSCDKSFAMTSSFTTMLISLLCIADDIPWQDKVDNMRSLADFAKGLIDDSWSYVKEKSMLDFNRIVYLGSGPLAGICKESALKMLELTGGHVIPWADTSLGFRHGPKSIVNKQTMLVHYVSDDICARQYDIDMLNEIKRDNTALEVVVIGDGGAQHGRRRCAVDVNINADIKAENKVAWSSPLYIINAQMLALFKSVSLKITPDNPFPGGEVNRVVQGVTIYN